MVRRTVKNFLRRLLALDDTPERIALAFAVGVFLAFSPLLGLHTLLGVAVAFLFRLNRVAVLLGVFVNNPWTLVPIYTAGTYLGGMFLGFPASSGLPDFGWRQLWKARYWVELAGQWRLLLPLVLGSSILAVLLALLSYPLALYVIKHGRGSSQRSSALP
jgi:uncharacterized protein (DUF2062 family)